MTEHWVGPYFVGGKVLFLPHCVAFDGKSSARILLACKSLAHLVQGERPLTYSVQAAGEPFVMRYLTSPELSSPPGLA